MMDGVPLNDLSRANAECADELEEAALRVLRSGRFILGPEVDAFEEELAAFCVAPHAVGVSSGTDALVVLLQAALARATEVRGRLPREPEIITTPYTFAATAAAIVRAGAVPVFADINPVTLTLDPEQARQHVTGRTVGIVPVHLFGHCAQVPELLQIAIANKLFIVEDAAQAIGSAHPTGTLGRASLGAALSFFPAKTLGGFGDGGAVVTHDRGIAKHVRVLRSQGSEQRYSCREVAGNYRLDALQAALLRVKLKYLDRYIEARQEAAGWYEQALASAPKDVVAGVPVEQPGYIHTYSQYAIDCEDRQEAMHRLQDHGVQHAIHYPWGLHEQPAFIRTERFPVTQAACSRRLSLPIFPGITEEEQQRVVSALKGS